MPTVTAVLATDPDRTFDALTDVVALPAWHERTVAVPERPPVLTESAEWVSEQALGSYRWRSRARVLRIDPQTRVFSHVSSPDDGNPSFSVWTWLVEEHPTGCRVSVTWRLVPRTFWRQRVGVHVRSAMLGREVAASLTALEHHVMTATRAALR